MAFTNRFSFIGIPFIPKESSKRPFYKEFKGGKDNKTEMASMNFGIKENDNNMAFVEGFDSKHDVIKTMSTDNEKIEIKWEDRFDEDSIKEVANYKKYTIDLGEEFGGRKDFISQYDALLHIKEWLPKYKGKIQVTGQFVKEEYKGTYYDKFKFQNIYTVEENQKSRLSLSVDVYYNKESIDKADYKEDKKIYLNGFISQYINKDEGNKYIPQQFVFNASKYDIENNDRHKALFDYKMKYIDIKNKTIVHIPWDIVLVRGAEGVEFDESMLTASQKEQVSLGIKTVDDFKPHGQIFGDRINEIRLFDPKLTDDFKDGLVDTEITSKEFEDLIYAPAKEEKMADIMNKTEDKTTETKTENKTEVDDEDLF